MPDKKALEITNLLLRWQAGDREAESALVSNVYPYLRALANKQLRDARSMTLQPTELAHEAYFRLVGQRDIDWQGRAHFFAAAARIVRHVVIDYLRERAAEKRGGAEITVSISRLNESELPSAESSMDMLRVDQALRELEAIDPRSARIVELRYFGGLSVAEAAAATGVSVPTVVRQWRATRAWLHTRLQDE